MSTTAQTNHIPAITIRMNHDGEKYWAYINDEILNKFQTGQRVVFHCKLGDYDQQIPVQLNALSTVYVDLNMCTLATDVDLGETIKTVFIDIVAKQVLIL